MNSSNLFRMALVIDTSHSRFLENLGNVIIYVVNDMEEKGKLVDKSELPDIIKQSCTLEFTYDEIMSSINAFSMYFYVMDDGIISLTEEGRGRIKAGDQSSMVKIVKDYINQHSMDRSVEEITQLLYKYIYNSLDTNIEALLNVVKGDEKSSSLHVMEKWENEDRKIVNDFIDWDNDEKNQLLYKTIAFAVDYCRLTVKKDGKNFGTILNGKKFYLDANIIFRLMGINNIQRKNTTERFVQKCKDAKIGLYYTSMTRKEILGSIKHHVDTIKQMMRGYKGKGSSLYKLSQKSNYEDDFLKFYLEWASSNNSYGKYDDFEQYLKRLFYESLKGIKEENTNEITISEDLLKGYMDIKDGYIRQENAEYDVQNVLYIKKCRDQRKNTTGWNINEYLISADHKLIDWSQKNINSANPIVVLPSVWYAIILKILGRTDEDEKAFAEFIKMRYVQTGPVDNLNYLINTVCNQAESGILQDMLFDEICESNSQINNIRLADEKEIDKIVRISFDKILDKTKEESYEHGKDDGKQNGFDDGLARGEKIGRIKAEIEQLKINATKNALKIRKRNIFIDVIVCIGMLVVVIAILYFIPIRLLPYEIQELFKSWGKIIVYIIPTGVVFAILLQIFPMDMEKIASIENAKIASKIQELERELKLYD